MTDIELTATMATLHEAILPNMLDEWLHRPHKVLQNRTPARCLETGHHHEVKALAEMIIDGTNFYD